MLVDYHMHTYLCKHANGTPEQYVNHAKKMGLGEIGFSDHMPMPPVYDLENRMEEWQFPEYLKLVEKAREAAAGFPVRLGIEGDYVPEFTEYVREFTANYNLDYVLGSVHYIGSWGFDNPKYLDEFGRRSLEDAYKEYFHLVIQAAESRLFDIISHFDLVKKFGHKPRRGYSDLAREALTAIKDNDLAIEINTSGFRKPVKEAYPSLEVLKIAGALEVPVTLGSDSHVPEDVGRDFDRIIPWLREAGYTHIQQFIGRKRIPVAIF